MEVSLFFFFLGSLSKVFCIAGTLNFVLLRLIIEEQYTSFLGGLASKSFSYICCDGQDAILQLTEAKDSTTNANASLES